MLFSNLLNWNSPKIDPTLRTPKRPLVFHIAVIQLNAIFKAVMENIDYRSDFIRIIRKRSLYVVYSLNEVVLLI